MPGAGPSPASETSESEQSRSALRSEPGETLRRRIGLAVQLAAETRVSVVLSRYDDVQNGVRAAVRSRGKGMDGRTRTH